MRMTAFDENSRSFRHGGHIGAGPKPGTRRAVNLTIDADILAAAKAQGINLSQTLEEELRRLTKKEREAKWQEENREAFESYNRFIAEHGIWSEKYRRW